MNKLIWTIAATVVMVAMTAFTGGTYAKQGVCRDGTPPPCSGGGGGGGGNEPPDFGDLIILYRGANGVPILSNEDDLCQQPIAFPSDTCILDCSGVNPCLVPVDPATCAVEAAYASCTQEVDFGRINEARAPDTVFESQLEDVVVNLATADCITLDPAGRLVASRVVDTELSTSAIDSPLQNLAIYRQLMLTGSLGDEADPISLPDSVLDTAARGLGAASDKTGEVNVDLIAYLNQIMGLSDPATKTILDPKICIIVREEVMGVVTDVEKCFLDYGAYGYNRTANFGALPNPAYVPELAPEDGWFEYLAEVEVDPPVSPPLFEIVQGPILDAVFGVDPGFLNGNIGGFAQAADDTRAVIDYMHNWPVPGDFPTPVPCAASGDIAYDVLISDVSGLQVPKNIVDGSEGREFFLSVANASGSADPASGTVTVTAIPENGGTIEGSPWTFTFTDLEPGETLSYPPTFFNVDLGERTTINWTATVVANFDVNLGNNNVTETSQVKVTGGGGGGKK